MNIRGVSLKNRTGNLLVSIGEFFCHQGKKLHSAERVRYWREAQETLKRAEENSVPCPITFPRFGGTVDLEEVNPALYHGLNSSLVGPEEKNPEDDLAPEDSHPF